jgi:VanZ family protein
MPIKRLLAPNKYALWLAILWTLFILLMCFKAPSGVTSITFLHADKIVHFAFYFVYIVLWYRFLLHKGNTLTRTKIYLIVTAVILGILIEIGQSLFTTTRHSDVLDIVANCLGASFGIFSLSLLYPSK